MDELISWIKENSDVSIEISVPESNHILIKMRLKRHPTWNFVTHRYIECPEIHGTDILNNMKETLLMEEKP